MQTKFQPFFGLASEAVSDLLFFGPNIYIWSRVTENKCNIVAELDIITFSKRHL